MSKDGFTRFPGVIASILHNDPGGQAAINAAAADLLAKADDPEAFLSEPYHTDRYVVALMVPMDNQAKRGSATKAAGKKATADRTIGWTYLGTGESGQVKI